MKKRVVWFFSFVMVVAMAGFGSWFWLNQSVGAGENAYSYLPFVSQPLSVGVSQMQVIQATQTTNNSVPMVANRQTAVRVFAESDGGPTSNAIVYVEGIRNGASLGVVESSPMTVPTATSQDDPATTPFFVLPNSWTSAGTLTIKAGVRVGGAEGPAQTMNVNFTTVPDFQVRVVPINYTHTGPTAPGFYPGQAVDYISDWMIRAYPADNIAVSFRGAHSFNGNLETDFNAWSTLLNQMYTLKIGDGLPESTPIFYYGFIPIETSSSIWFSSGIAGIGWISPSGTPYRESLGLNLRQGDGTGILAGHEIGHNMGRRHAPCGGAAGPDGNYPYAGGGIGQYGFDVPKSTFWRPSNSFDMMGYCSPEWISDYTYQAIYNEQRLVGRPAGDEMEQGVLLIANIGTNGDVNINPTYAFDMFVSEVPADSSYQVEFVNADGVVVASQPVRVRYAEEHGHEIYSIATTVALPTAVYNQIRITRDGELVAERLMNDATAVHEATLSVEETAEQVTLNWGVSTPALVRYTNDDGASWHTLSVDNKEGLLAVDVAQLAGGNGRFQIILADTAQPTILEANLSNPIADKAPMAWIIGATEMQAEMPITLHAGASDLEGHVSQYAWSIDGEIIGTERQLQLLDLPVGEHEITLTVTDSAGQETVTSTLVTVE